MTFKTKTCLSLLKVWSLINVIFSKTSTYLAIPQVRQPPMSESQKAEAFRGRKNNLYIKDRLGGLRYCFRFRTVSVKTIQSKFIIF